MIVQSEPARSVCGMRQDFMRVGGWHTVRQVPRGRRWSTPWLLSRASLMFLVMAPTFSTSWYLQQSQFMSDSALLLIPMHRSHATCALPEDTLQALRLLKSTATAEDLTPNCPIVANISFLQYYKCGFSEMHDQDYSPNMCAQKGRQQGRLAATSRRG